MIFPQNNNLFKTFTSLVTSLRILFFSPASYEYCYGVWLLALNIIEPGCIHGYMCLVLFLKGYMCSHFDSKRDGIRHFLSIGTGSTLIIRESGCLT